jgi:flagellar biosynthesis/type III secretory pathway chaperone
MTFSERMKDVLEQGWTATKELAAKTGAKAQDLSERGVLMWDIKQLESQAQKLITNLGNTSYRKFMERNESTIERDDVEIKTILDEIAVIRDAIEKKELDLKNRK